MVFLLLFVSIAKRFPKQIYKNKEIATTITIGRTYKAIDIETLKINQIRYKAKYVGKLIMLPLSAFIVMIMLIKNKKYLKHLLLSPYKMEMIITSMSILEPLHI